MFDRRLIHIFTFSQPLYCNTCFYFQYLYLKVQQLFLRFLISVFFCKCARELPFTLTRQSFILFPKFSTSSPFSQCCRVLLYQKEIQKIFKLCDHLKFVSTVVVRILALRNNNETLLIKKVVNLSIEKVIIIRFYLGIFLKIG